MRLFSDGAPASPADVTAAAVEPAPVAIGRFAVIRTLGTGGMGVVYLCRDPTLRRDVAIKLLRAEVGRDQQARLLREARALARLAHPHVVPVFEVGDHEGQVFLTMEHVDGVTLREWLGPERPWTAIVRAFVQAAAGLAAAHTAGIVHRDFKPSNVTIGLDGRVRVLDFGLAGGSNLAADADADSGAASSDRGTPSDPSGGTLTRTGALVGTPAYMAPEQAEAADVDARADQWSFCVALWEALYGARPYSPQQVRRGAVGPPRQARRRGPSVLRRVLLRGLSADPGARWPHMGALAHHLELTCQPWHRHRIAGAVFFTGSAAAVIAAASTPADSCDLAGGTIDLPWGDERRADARVALMDGAALAHQPAIDWWLAQLDRQGEAWVQAERTACRSRESVDPERAARIDACLQRSRDMLAALATATIDSPARTIAALGLDDAPLLDNDPVRCLQPAEVAPVPAVLSAMLAEAERDVSLGNAASARLLAGRARQSAVDLDSAHGETLATIVLGSAEIAEGATEAGIANLNTAVGLAEGARLDVEAAIAWLGLVDAALMHLHDAELAEPWLARAGAAVRRIDSDPALRFELLRAQAIHSSMRKDDAAAQAAFEHASTALLGLPDALPRRERLQLDRSNHHLTQGRIEEARAHAEAARSDRVERLGESHPSVAVVEITLGRIAQQSDDAPRAAQHFARAVELLEAAFGPASVRLSSPLAGLAESHFLQGALPEAAALAQRLVAIQSDLPASHPERGGGLALLGMISEARGDADLAASWYLDAADARKGLASPRQRTEAMNNAAWHLNVVGRASEARPLYQWIRAHTEADSEDHVFALAGLGRAAHLEGDPLAAIDLLEAALLGATRIDDPHPQLTPEIQWHLAAALASLGKSPERSRNLAAASLEQYEAHWPEQQAALAELRSLAGQRLAQEDLEAQKEPTP